MRIALIVIATIVTVKTAAFAQPTAEDLYAEGQAAYDRFDYARAIAKWQASYDLSKENGLLFNLAQAKCLSSDCTGSLATYRQFAAADADRTSDQHKLAEDFVREMEGTCKEPVLPPKAAERLNIADGRNADRAISSPGRTWKIAGIVTTGVGVATLATSLGLGHHGSSIGDEITAACTTSCNWAALKDKEARGRSYVSIGRTLDVAGVRKSVV